ncbi:MAG: hypothetical protein ACFFD4_07260 [Candidatus Odinarchaeota archaeon]
MIPIIERLEITNVAPFQTKNIVKFSKNGNKLLRQNGHGKTTLIESIEYSLFEEIHRKQKRVFLQKTLEEGVLQALWSFKGRKETFGSKLFPSKTLSITSSEKPESKSAGEKIYELIGYDFQLVHETFHFLCVKRESEATVIGEAKFGKLIQLLNEKNLEASGLTELVQRRKQVIERESIVLEKLKKINKKKNKFKEFTELFLTDVSVDDLKEEIEAIEDEIMKLENEISRLQGLEKEFENGRSSYYQKKFTIREEKTRFRQEIDERQSLIKRLEQEIIELEMLKSSKPEKITETIGTVPEAFETCDYCTRSLKETWQEFLVDQKCPACGRLMIVEDGEEGNSKKTAGIDDFNLEDVILSKKSQIDKEKAILANFTDQLEDVEKELEKIEYEMSDTQTSVEELQREIGFLSRELLSKKGRMSSLTVVKSHYEGFDYEKLLDEEMILTQEQERMLNAKKQVSEEINQRRSSKSFENFIQEGIRRFYPKQTFDVDFTRNIITFYEAGEEIKPVERDISNLSTAERYFLDLGVKVGIQEMMIYHGLIDRGLIILDSPEFALDKARRFELATVLNSLEDFQIIVTTRVESFYDALDGEEINITRAVRSLFDYFV